MIVSLLSVGGLPAVREAGGRGADDREVAVLGVGAAALAALCAFPFRCSAFFGAGRFVWRLADGLIDFGLRVVLEWPDERAECLAEDLTIVAFWSLIYLHKKARTSSRSGTPSSRDWAWGKAGPMLGSVLVHQQIMPAFRCPDFSRLPASWKK